MINNWIWLLLLNYLQTVQQTSAIAQGHQNNFIRYAQNQRRKFCQEHQQNYISSLESPVVEASLDCTLLCLGVSNIAGRDLNWRSKSNLTLSDDFFCQVGFTKGQCNTGVCQPKQIKFNNINHQTPEVEGTEKNSDTKQELDENSSFLQKYYFTDQLKFTENERELQIIPAGSRNILIIFPASRYADLYIPDVYPRIHALQNLHHFSQLVRYEGIAKRTVTNIGYEYIIIEEQIQSEISVMMYSSEVPLVVKSIRIEYEEPNNFKHVNSQKRGYRKENVVGNKVENEKIERKSENEGLETLIAAEISESIINTEVLTPISVVKPTQHLGLTSKPLLLKSDYIYEDYDPFLGPLAIDDHDFINQDYPMIRKISLLPANSPMFELAERRGNSKRYKKGRKGRKGRGRKGKGKRRRKGKGRRKRPRNNKNHTNKNQNNKNQNQNNKTHNNQKHRNNRPRFNKNEFAYAPSKYSWSFPSKVNFTKETCDACDVDNGTKIIKPQCIETSLSQNKRVPVNSELCTFQDKPAPRYQDCYEDDEFALLVVKCAPTWLSRPWSQCDCGTMQRQRQVSCWKILRKGVLSTVSDQVCESEAVARKPVDSEGCICTKAQEQVDAMRGDSEQAVKQLGGWIVGDWSHCDSVNCGTPGKQKRIVYCESRHGCAGNKPSTELLCEKATNECQYQWTSTQWNKCDCTNMIHVRNVSCEASIENRIVKASYCFEGDKPTDKQPCSDSSCVRWSVGKWSKCSRCRAWGIQRRSLTCSRNNHKVDDNVCKNLKRPDTFKKCLEKNCAYWRTGGWSVCHEGRARRLVACSDPKNEFACASLIKPESSKRC